MTASTGPTPGDRGNPGGSSHSAPTPWDAWFAEFERRAETTPTRTDEPRRRGEKADTATRDALMECYNG